MTGLMIFFVILAVSAASVAVWFYFRYAWPLRSDQTSERDPIEDAKQRAFRKMTGERMLAEEQLRSLLSRHTGRRYPW